jgi:hypothetical protein
MCRTHKEKRNAYRVGKSERRKPLGIPRRSWQDNIRMYLGEIETNGYIPEYVPLHNHRCDNLKSYIQ